MITATLDSGKLAQKRHCQSFLGCAKALPQLESVGRNTRVPPDSPCAAGAGGSLDLGLHRGWQGCCGDGQKGGAVGRGAALVGGAAKGRRGRAAAALIAASLGVEEGKFRADKAA